jgi:hypothetical protein
MWQFLFKDEADQIVGTCFEVDNENECGFGTCVKIGKLGLRSNSNNTPRLITRS